MDNPFQNETSVDSMEQTNENQKTPAYNGYGGWDNEPIDIPNAPRQRGRISAFGSSGDGRISHYENGVGFDQYIANSQAARRLQDYAGYQRLGQGLTNIVLNQRNQRKRQTMNNNAALGWMLDAAHANPDAQGVVPKESLQAVSQQLGTPVGGAAFNGSDFVILGADNNGNLSLDRNGKPVPIATISPQMQFKAAKQTGLGIRNAQKIYDALAQKYTPEQLAGMGYDDPKTWMQTASRQGGAQAKRGAVQQPENSMYKYDENGSIIDGDWKFLGDEIAKLEAVPNRTPEQEQTLGQMKSVRQNMFMQYFSKYNPPAPEAKQVFRPRGHVAGQGSGMNTVWYQDQNGSAQKAEVGKPVRINGEVMVFNDKGEAMTVQEAAAAARQELQLRSSGGSGDTGDTGGKGVGSATLQRSADIQDVGEELARRRAIMKGEDPEKAAPFRSSGGKPDVPVRETKPSKPVAGGDNEDDGADVGDIIMKTQKHPNETEEQFLGRKIEMVAKNDKRRFESAGGTSRVGAEGDTEYELKDYEFLTPEEKAKYPKIDEEIRDWHGKVQEMINDRRMKIESARKIEERSVILEAKRRFPTNAKRRNKFIEERMNKWDIDNDPRREKDRVELSTTIWAH